MSEVLRSTLQMFESKALRKIIESKKVEGVSSLEVYYITRNVVCDSRNVGRIQNFGWETPVDWIVKLRERDVYGEDGAPTLRH